MSELVWLEASNITFPLAAGTKLLVDETAEPDFEAVKTAFTEENVIGLELIENGRTVTLTEARSNDNWSPDRWIKKLFEKLAPIIPDGCYAQFENRYVDTDSRKHRLIIADEQVIENFPNVDWDDPVELATRQKATAPFSINLDADSVRAEVRDAYLHGSNPHEHTAQDVETLVALDDHTIGNAIDASLDNIFWSVYDNTRSDVISRLSRQLDTDDTDDV